jgi:hypothetical protein
MNANVKNTPEWTVALAEDPDTGELIMPIPQEIMDELGWQIDDALVLDTDENGFLTLAKKAEDSMDSDSSQGN